MFPIYFQRDLLSTNLLSTRSTFNEGFEDARRDLLSTRSTFNEELRGSYIGIDIYTYIFIYIYIYTQLVESRFVESRSR